MDQLYHSLTPDQQLEDRKLRALQTLVDNAGRRIVTGQLTKIQAQQLADEVRQAACRLIPDQMELYDRIYGSRFKHWINYFYQEGSIEDKSA